MRNSPICMFINRANVYCSLAAVIVALAVALPAKATIVKYTNRALWQADAGPISATENFNSFLVDTAFQASNGPLSVNGFSLVMVGPPTAGNTVDVPPFTNAPLNVNGTAFASCAADFGKYYVELRFTSPVRAFGANFTNATLATGPNAEALNFDIYSSNGTLLETIVPIKADNVFYGFTTTSGEAASYMIFHSTSEGGSIIRSAWGMDNVDIAFVPEPTTSAFVGIAVVAGFGARCRRK